jgi:hypothetical protein
MPAGKTYTQISSQTLTSNTGTINLGSFSGYTDLRIILTYFTAGNGGSYITVNSSTSGYSECDLYGNSASSGGSTTYAVYFGGVRGDLYFYGNYEHNSTTTPGSLILDIPYYERTDTNHMLFYTRGTTVGGAAQTAYETSVGMGQWANTSAITSVQLNHSGSFAAGTVVSVYGITEA